SALPSTLDVTNRQVSPRVGVAWTPADHWVIRAGAGTFADRIVLASLVKPLALDGRTGFEQIVQGAAAATVLRATEGGSLVTPLSNVPPSIYTARSNDWHSSSQQASVGIERGITPDLTASFTYLYVRGRGLPRTVNVNLPAPVLQEGRGVFGPT